MYATAETAQDFDVALFAQDIPAKIGRPFEVAEIGAKAVPWAVEQRPYQGPQNSDAAQLSSVRRDCVKLPTRIVTAKLLDPGELDQQFFLREDFPALDEVACGSVKRLVDIRTEFKRRNRWIPTDHPAWLPTLFIVDSPEQTREAQVASQFIGTGHGLKARCGDRARFKVRAKAQDINTKKIVGQRIGTYPVKIAGKICKRK